jgi:hypothetical protein
LRKHNAKGAEFYLPNSSKHNNEEKKKEKIHKNPDNYVKMIKNQKIYNGI